MLHSWCDCLANYVRAWRHRSQSYEYAIHDHEDDSTSKEMLRNTVERIIECKIPSANHNETIFPRKNNMPINTQPVAYSSSECIICLGEFDEVF